MTDIEIAQATKMTRIDQLAKEKLGITDDHLEPYGHYKSKLSLEYIKSLEDRPDGHLVLVTAISPTPAGEGKTTTTVGLGDGLNRLGRKAIIALREPSLGPCFGVKGGAAGGGYAQVVPMEDINLHFTGDFHAVGAAHNLLAAMIDNHIHHGNELQIDPRLVQFKRVVDMNDRALRKITVGMGGVANGFLREDGFDIVVASEVMAVLCLASSVADLKKRLGDIVIGYTRGALKDRMPISARDLKADGAMAALLKDAIKPNLVQTLEKNVAMIHGGPFANIAHGCNSVMATKAALKLADYTITEAGFGADLGAEKFVDIKCRAGGLKPKACVLVVTLKALKYHGGAAVSDCKSPNLEALKEGFSNLDKHIHNISQVYKLPLVVSLNLFNHDTEEEVKCLIDHVAALGFEAVVADHWARGGAGAEDLAKKVIAACEKSDGSSFSYVYEDDIPLLAKIEAIATKVYGAKDVVVSAGVQRKLEEWTKLYPTFPVCMAKTQSSFSSNAALRGAPTGHTIEVREVRLNRGAGFVVALCGDIMTMPGLPKKPAAESIDITEEGRVLGLF